MALGWDVQLQFRRLNLEPPAPQVHPCHRRPEGKARLSVPSPVKGKEPREGPSLMLVWQPTPPAFAAPKTLWAGEVTPIVDTQPRSSCRHRSNCAELLRGA